VKHTCHVNSKMTVGVIRRVDLRSSQSS